MFFLVFVWWKPCIPGASASPPSASPPSPCAESRTSPSGPTPPPFPPSWSPPCTTWLRETGRSGEYIFAQNEHSGEKRNRLQIHHRDPGRQTGAEGWRRVELFMILLWLFNTFYFYLRTTPPPPCTSKTPPPCGAGALASCWSPRGGTCTARLTRLQRGWRESFFSHDLREPNFKKAHNQSGHHLGWGTRFVPTSPLVFFITSFY